MNDFVEKQWDSMHSFLRIISTPHKLDGNVMSAPQQTASDSAIDSEIDLGKDLSLLHSCMCFCLDNHQIFCCYFTDLQESWSHQVCCIKSLFSNYCAYNMRLLGSGQFTICRSNVAALEYNCFNINL